ADGGPPAVANARARFARPCVALAAGGTRGIAGDLVAVASNPAGATPHRLPGNPAAVRPDTARGDAGAYAMVADPVAYCLGLTGHPRVGASLAQPAEPSRRHRSHRPARCRRLGRGARWGPTADRGDR